MTLVALLLLFCGLTIVLMAMKWLLLLVVLLVVLAVVHAWPTRRQH